eukprot:scaffold5126_cov190-Amphora_coffeaeformis.AAC.6
MDAAVVFGGAIGFEVGLASETFVENAIADWKGELRQQEENTKRFPGQLLVDICTVWARRPLVMHAWRCTQAGCGIFANQVGKAILYDTTNLF